MEQPGDLERFLGDLKDLDALHRFIDEFKDGNIVVIAQTADRRTIRTSTFVHDCMFSELLGLLEFSKQQILKAMK